MVIECRLLSQERLCIFEYKIIFLAMKSLKTYNSEIQLDERGFLRIAFNDTDDEIEFDEIKQQIDACYIISEGKPIPVLIDVRNGKKNLSPEARNYAGKQNPHRHLARNQTSHIPEALLNCRQMKMADRRFHVKTRSRGPLR